MKRTAFWMTMGWMSATAGLFSPGGVASASDSCEEPGRSPRVCYSMKQLRASIGVLDAERDLMQADLTVIEALSGGIAQVAGKLLSESHLDTHLKKLGEVRTAALEASELARAGDVQAFRASNAIRTNCLACHASHSEGSNLGWDKISEEGWDKIVPGCNQPGKNPYFCKSMFGLLSAIRYFESAAKTGQPDFVGTEKVASTAVRIGLDLLSKGMVHGREGEMARLVEAARNLQADASRQDPATFDRVGSIVNACLSCHGPDLSPRSILAAPGGFSPLESSIKTWLP